MPGSSPLDEDLKDIGALTPGDGDLLVGDGSDWTGESVMTSSTGLLKHEKGGIELDISAVTTGDVLAGASAGTMAIVAASGASDGDYLTIQADGTAAWETPAAAGGQTLVTRIVAASGGDHTTLTAALAAASNGDCIFVRPGTYTEGGTISSSLTDITILGAGPNSAIIDMEDNALTLSGAGLTIRDLGITEGNATMTFSGANQIIDNCEFNFTPTSTHSIAPSNADSVFSNCKFIDAGTTGTNYRILTGATRITFRDCYFLLNPLSTAVGAFMKNAAQITMSGCTFKNTGSGTGSLCTDWAGGGGKYIGCSFVGDDSTSIRGLWLKSGPNSQVIGCHFQDITSDACLDIDSNNVSVNSCLFNSGTAIAIEVSAAHCKITNNDIQTTGAYGIDLGSNCYSSTFTNNTINGPTTNHIRVNSACYRNYFAMNGFAASNPSGDSLALSNLGGIGDTIVSHISEGGASEEHKRTMRKMKNTSGGNLNKGDIVTFKAVAAGDEVTTTTAQGDDLVYGMLLEDTNSNLWGNVLIEGETTLLKVDGTTDIAIGDFIGTFTSAGIGMKAAAGDMAIAIALEAYTTDDSNGVINAILISPRKI